MFSLQSSSPASERSLNSPISTPTSPTSFERKGRPRSTTFANFTPAAAASLVESSRLSSRYSRSRASNRPPTPTRPSRPHYYPAPYPLPTKSSIRKLTLTTIPISSLYTFSSTCSLSSKDPAAPMPSGVVTTPTRSRSCSARRGSPITEIYAAVKVEGESRREKGVEGKLKELEGRRLRRVGKIPALDLSNSLPSPPPSASNPRIEIQHAPAQMPLTPPSSLPSSATELEVTSPLTTLFAAMTPGLLIPDDYWTDEDTDSLPPNTPGVPRPDSPALSSSFGSELGEMEEMDDIRRWEDEEEWEVGDVEEILDDYEDDYGVEREVEVEELVGEEEVGEETLVEEEVQSASMEVLRVERRGDEEVLEVLEILDGEEGVERISWLVEVLQAGEEVEEVAPRAEETVEQEEPAPDTPVEESMTLPIETNPDLLSPQSVDSGRAYFTPPEEPGIIFPFSPTTETTTAESSSAPAETSDASTIKTTPSAEHTAEEPAHPVFVHNNSFNESLPPLRSSRTRTLPPAPLLSIIPPTPLARNTTNPFETPRPSTAPSPSTSYPASSPSRPTIKQRLSSKKLHPHWSPRHPYARPSRSHFLPDSELDLSQLSNSFPYDLGVLPDPDGGHCGNCYSPGIRELNAWEAEELGGGRKKRYGDKVRLGKWRVEFIGLGGVVEGLLGKEERGRLRKKRRGSEGGAGGEGGHRRRGSLF